MIFLRSRPDRQPTTSVRNSKLSTIGFVGALDGSDTSRTQVALADFVYRGVHNPQVRSRCSFPYTRTCNNLDIGGGSLLSCQGFEESRSRFVCHKQWSNTCISGRHAAICVFIYPTSLPLCFRAPTWHAAIFFQAYIFDACSSFSRRHAGTFLSSTSACNNNVSRYVHVSSSSSLALPSFHVVPVRLPSRLLLSGFLRITAAPYWTKVS